MAKNPLATMMAQAVNPNVPLKAPGGKKVIAKISPGAPPPMPGVAPPAAPKPSAKKIAPFRKK